MTQLQNIPDFAHTNLKLLTENHESFRVSIPVTIVTHSLLPAYGVSRDRQTLFDPFLSCLCAVSVLFIVVRHFQLQHCLLLHEKMDVLLAALL